MTETNTLTDKVAKFIRDKRIALGMSQEQFAAYIFDDKKRRPWISKIENGRGITVITLDRILTKLNAHVEIVEY